MFSQAINSLLMALDSLAHNKVRAMLTMLGIIIGVGSVITMTAIGTGAQKAVNDQIAGMGTNVLMIFPSALNLGGLSTGAGGSQHITEDDATALKKGSSLFLAVSPMVNSSVQAIAGNENWATKLNGVLPEYLTIRNWKPIQGANFTDADERTENKVCLLGKTVVDNLFQPGANPVGQIVRIKHLPFTVVGVLEPKGANAYGQDQDDIILAPFSTVQKKVVGITWANMIMSSTITADATAEAEYDVSTILRVQHKLQPKDPDDFQVRSQVELAQAASQNASTLTNLLRNAAIIALLVGGIGIMNIMLVTVTERTREIGIRKSIGAKQFDILLQFLTEAVTLSLVGGIIGVGLGYVASFVISKNNGWVLVISPSATLISFGAAALVGVFFGWYPARKAARLNPIEALRYE
jgi:putative ABC transport system permease protein